MSAIRTARERARQEVTNEIVAEARRQLASEGASKLSLRSVARELGMVSSGIYRYVKSRDELLTTLIVEAYDSLGERAERAAAGEGTPLERWMATAAAIRSWALERPHEYALIFGTPVPGYAAPAETSVAGTRASRALVGVVRDAWAAGEVDVVDDQLSDVMRDEMRALATEVGFDGPPVVLLAVLAAWSQMFGLITFELFGQTRGIVEDHGALFDATTRRMARQIGLRDGG